MSKTARKRFEIRAKAYALDLSRGVYGEWLNAETSKCWYFWITSWQARARDINKRAASGKTEVEK
jgi:hypothetical protein